jgi:D-sedoheptulose 7-phosphate isomerase
VSNSITPSTLEVWQSTLSDAKKCLEEFISSKQSLELCSKFSEMLTQTVQGGGNVFTCGNGGSHCDSMHFAEELTGRYRKDRKPMGALALGDASHITCVANDFGFEYIFSRQLEGLGRKGDLLIGLSTSGNSKNVINAFETAKSKGIKSVALLGKDGGQLKSKADLAILVPGRTADRIQEMHIKLLHTVIETLERAVLPEHYSSV